MENSSDNISLHSEATTVDSTVLSTATTLAKDNDSSKYSIKLIIDNLQSFIGFHILLFKKHLVVSEAI